MQATITRTELGGLKLIHRGKVRDVYEVGEHLLIVATDRISAYDSVLSPGIPDKGRVLTSLSIFWFDALKDVVGNHLITADTAKMPPAVQMHASVLRGRSMLVKRLTMLPVECVARGYLAGSGWKDYRRTGQICGHVLPPGMKESARLDPPVFTPATKATSGHDENIDFETTERILGPAVAAQARDLTLALYGKARETAGKRGILIADTKLEFGHDEKGRLTLGDEAFTPDSSRFWDAAKYAPGKPQESFDKQGVRDWLDAQGWDHTPPPPVLAPEIVARTTAVYREIHDRITGRDLAP